MILHCGGNWALVPWPYHQRKETLLKNGSEHHDAFDEFLQMYIGDKSKSMQKINKTDSYLWYEQFENIEQLNNS